MHVFHRKVILLWEILYVFDKVPPPSPSTSSPYCRSNGRIGVYMEGERKAVGVDLERCPGSRRPRGSNRE